MKTFILTLIAACIVMITSADGVTLDQLRKAGRKARIETNTALSKTNGVTADQLRKAGRKARIETNKVCKPTY